MSTIKQALAQALVMLVLLVLAVAGIDLLMYIWLEVLPDEAVVVAVLCGAVAYLGRVCHEG